MFQSVCLPAMIFVCVQENMNDIVLLQISDEAERNQTKIIYG